MNFDHDEILYAIGEALILEQSHDTFDKERLIRVAAALSKSDIGMVRDIYEQLATKN